MPDEIVVKEIKLDNKVICKYHMDGHILYINVVNRFFEKGGKKIKDLEEHYHKIIQILENRKFVKLAYLNV